MPVDEMTAIQTIDINSLDCCHFVYWHLAEIHFILSVRERRHDTQHNDIYTSLNGTALFKGYNLWEYFLSYEHSLIVYLQSIKE